MRRHEVINKLTARLSQLRHWYERLPYVKRSVVVLVIALCVMAVASVYVLSKQTNTPADTGRDDKLRKDEGVVSPSSPQSKGTLPTLPSRVGLPSDRLDLTNWKIALPVDTDHAGSPDEIEQPEIKEFSLTPYFVNNPSGEGVLFRAHAGGATTKNSKYPRSELREMTDNGSEEASWSNVRGRHTMIVRQAVTHLPEKKPEVVTAQIHDDSDDIVMVRLHGNYLFVEADGEDIGVLDADYRLGTPYTVTITAEDSKIKVFYNNILKVTYDKDGSDYYFKAGCYTQTNTDKGDRRDAYGEVIIYSLYVVHE